MKNNVPVQLTFEDYGHTLHHTQISSMEGDWLVYDTRNDDTKINETSSIELLNTTTLEIKRIYQTENQSLYGPGVGAATFSPKENKVIFIHGIRNCSEANPYSATRRTGVAISLDFPNQPIFMDARNIQSPFTAGALRGGTHSHSWHENGKWISFTYNDYVLEQQAKIGANVLDQRVVGMMFPKKVEVPLDKELENNCGEMFSVIVSKVVLNAQNGSDEIEKAFDECWVKNSYNIAFQGNVRGENGELKTEIFIANIPNEIIFTTEDDLKGSFTSIPTVPQCISQKRITFTEKGISSFRHWLRSSPTGNEIYFLMEDELQITQIFGVELEFNQITQYTFLEHSIDSPFNVSEDGGYIVFFSDAKIYVVSLESKRSEVVYNSNNYNSSLTGVPSFSLNRKKIYFNQFIKNKNGKNIIQLFSLENNFKTE